MSQPEAIQPIRLGDKTDPIPPRVCCGGKEVTQEVSDAILEWRVAICEKCCHHSMGLCTSTLVDLPRNIRRVGVACPLGRW